MVQKFTRLTNAGIGDVSSCAMVIEWGHVFVCLQAVANMCRLFSVPLLYTYVCNHTVNHQLQILNNFDIEFIIIGLKLHHESIMYLRHLCYIKDKID